MPDEKEYFWLSFPVYSNFNIPSRFERISPKVNHLNIDRIKSIEKEFWLKENEEINFIAVFKLHNHPDGKKTQSWRLPLIDMDIEGVRACKD